MPKLAKEVAKQFGIEPKKYRRTLRSEELSWHQHGSRYDPPDNSPEHYDMIRVAKSLLSKQ
ncbi:MAG: hypothetical protein OXC63_06545 [Aestuariivita sp.]|nr:hypothetical protein [Aestuariivita sp.]MCY4348120.1 hypothetical protein [Aestuariivita sp.]